MGGTIRTPHTRLLAALLAVMLTLSLLLPIGRAAESGDPVTGSVSATLRIDYEQTLEEIRERDVRVEVLQDGASLGKLPLYESAESTVGGYPAAVAVRNQDGEQLIAGNLPGYLDLEVRGLPTGRTYTLRFSGRGYTTYAEEVLLEDYAWHIIAGTGDASFTLGDVNSDGRVDEQDRAALSAALGSESPADVTVYDLSGDGKIDITDLAYINRQLGATETAQPLETFCLRAPLDVAETRAELEDQPMTVAGELEDLFLDNDRSVSFTPLAEQGNLTTPLTIPLTLSRPLETTEIQIVSPVDHALTRGTISVMDENGNEVYSEPYNQTLPEGIHAIGRIEGKSVITIDLGRRVAVKKITITVEEVPEGYVAVETIQFLKDIVPENPVAPNSEIKNLQAQPGSEKVTLTWGVLPNISGYLVTYWPTDGSETARELRVDVNRAEVTGLENNTEYQFTVTPMDGSWTGKASAPVTASPLPAAAPSAPDMVNVSAGDGALSVSWKAAENATYYEVYYTDQENAPTASYTQSGGRLASTSTAIGGLTNGVTYYIYIIAGNDIGRSGPSRISTGTPKAVDYSRPEGIPAAGILDNSKIESIRLADTGNYNSGAYTADAPFTPQNMIDGDYHTHWTASNNWGRDEHVICTFTEPVDLTAAIWVPRMDGSYPSWLRAYSVRVWFDGDDLSGAGTQIVPAPATGISDSAGSAHDWPDIPNRASIPTSRFAIMPFGTLENVVKISVAAEQAGYNVVSCSELMFMEYDPERCLPDNIAALFTDGLYTSLKADVTQADIDALSARLNSDERNYYLNTATLADELKLAQELLDSASAGQAGPTGTSVILRGVDSRSNGADSAKYKQSGSDLQPLGAAARAKQEITVYAQGIPAGQTVTVYASQFNAEASTWRAEVGKLSNGRNILTVPQIGSQNTPRGGSLYFTYSGAGAENIQLHVRQATPIPVLDLSDWYQMDESGRRAAIQSYINALTSYVADQKITSANQTTEYRNVTEIATPTVLLSIPASSALGGLGSADKVQQLYNSVLAWEDLLHICKTTQGIDNTYGNNDMQSRQNIRCMQMFTGAFMYAAGNHIGIGFGSCSGMVGGQPIANLGENATANSLFGWGIAHEIGHNMDKLGKAEITNNIYSIMAQTYDGKQNTLASRLENSSKYQGIFTKVAQGYPGASNDVFVQLGLYWQLHLAYDDGEDPMWFYNQFFKDWKAGTYTAGASSYDDKVALTAAGVAQKNLTEFFTRWGMTLSSATKDTLAGYGQETRAIWYLNDQSRRDRLSGAEAGVGAVAASAEKIGDNSVLLTLGVKLDAGRVQGYEIRRNGVPIDFTTGTTYTDVIGSGNHRTYIYEVAAYDTLGNEIGTAPAGEIRIAYDKTVPESEYSLTREGGNLTFTFNQETSVSGLKVTPAPDNGEFTVTVTDGEGKAHTARSGSFADNLAVDDAASFVTYFQKPGASVGDTRIWTYDAKTVTVTGVPEDAMVQLISYAGDDVAFLEGATAGILAADYRYGGGVISAGTLIIAGSYRGDPLYNTVRIQGRFSKTALDENGEPVESIEERPLDGYALLFAEIPADGAVSDISDGIFIFVPNVQKEAELQEASSCKGVNLLPSQIKAELGRTDTPSDSGFGRVTAETLWINSPGGNELPTIELKGGDQQ